MSTSFAINHTTVQPTPANLVWEAYRVTTTCKGKRMTTTCQVARMDDHTWRVDMASQSFTNRHYTVAVTRLPGYSATAVCECTGFVTHNHCKHQAIAVQAAQNAADCEWTEKRIQREMYV